MKIFRDDDLANNFQAKFIFPGKFIYHLLRNIISVSRHETDICLRSRCKYPRTASWNYEILLKYFSIFRDLWLTFRITDIKNPFYFQVLNNLSIRYSCKLWNKTDTIPLAQRFPLLRESLQKQKSMLQQRSTKTRKVESSTKMPRCS